MTKMNWLNNILNRFFIDRNFGRARSQYWQGFRERHIKDECEACHSKYFLELHHIRPVWVSPELELIPDNCVTLCRTCHFFLGHFRDWTSWNVNIKEWIYQINNK